MRVALVHESFSRYGGAERVLEELARAFPAADIFTLEGAESAPVGGRPVRASFLQRLPRWARQRRWGLPFYPLAPESFDLSAYDVILSSASAFAKGVVTRPSSLHICYCHAPARFLWDAYASLLEEFPSGTIRRGSFQLLMHLLRLWDRAAARRVDRFVANSEATRARIWKYYRREAAVIYPPVRLPRAGGPAASGRTRRYFLFVGRLSPYKRAGLAVQTFTKLSLPLVVVGRGRAASALRRMAGPQVTFLPGVSDQQLAGLYRGARAVIFPSDDDFGLVPVEAMGCGTPVLALRRGGARETVIEGVTGEFFDEPLEELLADCLRRFLDRERAYQPAVLQAHAARFSAARFRRQIRTWVERQWENKKESYNKSYNK